MPSDDALCFAAACQALRPLGTKAAAWSLCTIRCMGLHDANALHVFLLHWVLHWAECFCQDTAAPFHAAMDLNLSLVLCHALGHKFTVHMPQCAQQDVDLLADPKAPAMCIMSTILHKCLQF